MKQGKLKPKTNRRQEKSNGRRGLQWILAGVGEIDSCVESSERQCKKYKVLLPQNVFWKL